MWQRITVSRYDQNRRCSVVREPQAASHELVKISKKRDDLSVDETPRAQFAALTYDGRILMLRHQG